MARIFILSLMLLSFAGCQKPVKPGTESDAVVQNDQTPDVSVAPTQPQSNDLGFATVDTPEGWLPYRSNGTTAIIFCRPGVQKNNAEEMISIDIGNPMEGSLEASAKSLARKFGGTAETLSFTIDGEPAYRVSVPPHFDNLMPRECVTMFHDGKVVFVFGASKTQADIWPVVQQIASTWKWND